jgi:moderate conductance mechanosensitive channel
MRVNSRFLLDPQFWDASVSVGARVLATIALAWLVHRLVFHFIRAYGRRGATDLAHTEQARRTETLARVFKNLTTALIVAIAGTLVLSELDISVTPILGAAGVFGLALGFGAQSLMKDYVAGFFLLFENQVARGDVIEVAGKSGAVEDVRLRYLQLRDYDGNVHFVPNGLITTVTNSSRGFAYAVVEVGVAYSTELSAVYEALRAVAVELRADPAFAGSIEDQLEITGVEKLDGVSVSVRSRLRVRPLEQWRVRREFLHRMKLEFDRQGIKLPAPPLALVSR